MNPAAPDNRMVWDRIRSGHFERWYLVFHHRATGTGFWVEYCLTAPLPETGESAAAWLRFAAFRPDGPPIVAVRRRYPTTALLHSTSPFCLEIGPSVLRHGAARGTIEGKASGPISWSFTFNPSTRGFRPFPPWLYLARAVEHVVTVPNPAVALHGEVRLGDATWTLEDDPGSQGHVFGRRNPEQWAWARCSAFPIDPRAHVEVLAAPVRLGGSLSPVVGVLRLRTSLLGPHGSGVRDLLLTRWEQDLDLWRFSGGDLSTRVEGEVRCAPEGFVQDEDRDPDGRPVFRHHGGTASMRLRLLRRSGVLGGMKEIGLLQSDGLTHVEFGDRLPDARVPARMIPVAPVP